MNYNHITKYILFFIIILTFSLILKKKNINKTNILLISFFILILLYIIDDFSRKEMIKESFNPQYAPIRYSIGPLDNLKLKPTGCSNWRHPPACMKLYKPSTLYTPQGTPFPLKPKIIKSGINNGPSVDGTKKTPNDMFMFAYNQCRPECCPSTYSCDHGCVCTTEQQRKFINTRGKNRISSNLKGISIIDA